VVQTYGLDSYRQACIAIAQAEKSATVTDLSEPKAKKLPRIAFH